MGGVNAQPEPQSTSTKKEEASKEDESKSPEEKVTDKVVDADKFDVNKSGSLTEKQLSELLGASFAVKKTSADKSKSDYISYADAKKKVDEFNSSIDTQLTDAIKGIYADKNNKITSAEKAIIDAAVQKAISNSESTNTQIAPTNKVIDAKEEEVNKNNAKQITNIEKQIKDYLTKYAQYKEDLNAYASDREEYISNLKKLGLWNGEDVDPATLSQLLSLKDEKQAKVTIKDDFKDTKSNVVKEKDTILEDSKGNPLLTYFYHIKDTTDGNFLRVTYTNLKNSTYNGKKIKAIVVTYSDFKTSNNPYQDGVTPGIYFGSNPLDGFFYKKASSVTMEIKMYHDYDRKTETPKDLVKFADNSAYVTAGSLNSKGKGSDYIEKAKLLSDGEGVKLPESSVTVHTAKDGHDVLYSNKNNEIISGSSGEKIDKTTAQKIWGKDIVKEYSNWDNPSNKKDAIFGAGLFKVSGKSIKIKYSNKLGSAWAPVSTNIPKLAFNKETPTEPKLEITWQPNKLKLHDGEDKNESKNVTETIHYRFEDGRKAADNSVKSVNFTRTGLKDNVTGDTTWSDWSSAQTFDVVKSPVLKGYTADKLEVAKQTVNANSNNLDFIVTYKKNEPTTVTGKKPIKETIHYVYKDGATAKPDVEKTVTVTRQGKQDQATDEITWGNYDKANFDSVVSPAIKGYTADKAQIDKQTTDKDLVFTVTYDKLPNKDVSDQKDVKETIHYVYEDGSVAKPDYSKTVTLTRSGKQDQVTDKFSWDNWSTDEFDAVTSPEIKGYTADKAQIDEQVADKDLEFTVVYSKLPDKDVTDSKPIKETIHYVYKGGTTAKPDVEKTVTVTRQGKQDQATDEITWGNYDKANFDVVVTPAIKGYTADQAQIDKQTTDKDLVFTVTYDKLPDKDLTDSKPIKETIHYVYKDGTTAKPDVEKTITVTRQGKQDQATDKITWGNYDKANFDAVVSPEIKGYTADKVQIDKQTTDKDLVFNVTYDKLPDKNVSDKRDVKEIIHYVYEDGTTAKPDYSKTITLTRNGKQDQAIDEITWNDWSTVKFNAVTSPEIKGYVADKVQIDEQDADKDLEFTVVYSKLPDKAVTDSKPITETIHYVYKDGITAKPDVEKTVTVTRQGKQDQATDQITWDNYNSANFDTVISPEVKGYSVDKSQIDKQTTDKDLVFTVTYDKLPDKDVSDQKDVKEVIHYVYEDGSIAKPDYSKTVTLTRDGKQDQSTDEITWSDWSTDEFDVVTSPEIKGYTADKTQIDKQNADKDLEFTVVYSKLPDKDVTDSKPITETIHYVYKDGTTAKPDVEKTVAVARQGKQDQATDKITWGSYGKANFDAIETPQIKGYTADKAQIDKQTTDKDLVFTVTYDKLPDKDITDQKDVKEIIHYVYENGTVAKPDYSKTVTLNRHGKQDMATDKVTWSDWSTDEFNAVKSPEIKGYTADKAQIDKQVADKDLEFTVVYSKLPNRDVSDSKPITETIHYIYKDGTIVKPDVVKTVTVSRDGKQDQATDKITWNAYNKADFDVVESPEIKGYTADKAQIDKQTTDKDLVFTVTYDKLPDKDITDQKTVKEIIHYVYEDGTAAKPDYSKSVTLTRKGKQDKATDEITWSDWSTDEFDIVKSPKIKGYVADKLEIAKQSADKDLEFTIIYTPEVQKAHIKFVDDDSGENGTVLATEDINDGHTDESIQFKNASTTLKNYLDNFDFVSLVDETPQTAARSSFMLFAATLYVAGKTQNVLTEDANEALNYNLGNFNNDSSTDQQFVVHLKHHIEDDTRTRTVHQHVEYLYGEGDKKDTKLPTDVAQDFDKDLTYSENGKVDKTYEAYQKGRSTNPIADKTTWDENSIQQVNFDTVNSPKVGGYHYDIATIDPDDVTVTNDNWDNDDLDTTAQVRYYANSQTAHIKFYDDTAKKFVQDDDGNDFEEVAKGKTGEEITLRESLPKSKKLIDSIMDENDHTLPYLPQFNMFDVSGIDDATDTHESRKLADEGSVQNHIGNFDDNDTRSQLFIVHVKTPAPAPQPDPKPTPAPETHKITVTYKDDVTGETLDTESFTGKSGESANYSTTSTIDTFKDAGYTLDSDETNGKPLVFSNRDQSYLVKLGHATDDVTITKTITRTIIGKTPNGDDINVKQPVTLTKVDTKDKVTGEIIKQGTWDNGTWNKYDVPQFPGYTSQIEGKDGVQVTEKGVTSDTPDEIVTVSYVAIPSPNVPTPEPDTPNDDPEPIPDSTPVPDKDPEPSTPDHDPEKKEVSQAPEVPEKKVAEHRTSKKAVIPTQTVKKSTIVFEPVVEKTASPVAKIKTSKKSTNTEKQNTLPQTGAKDENLASMLGLMIASVGAIFGLAAGKKRKND